jgi:surface antigen
LHAARRLLPAAARRALVVLASLLATCAVSLPLAAPASAAGDDYPYRSTTSNVADRWGFTVRQCVSFVAWREAQSGHPLDNAAEHWGSALNWDETARARGVAISSRPRVGAIAQWNANERSAWYANGSTSANGYVQAGPYGHVAWVKAVYADGSVLAEQYNMSGNRSYSTMRLKAPRYLYYEG